MDGFGEKELPVARTPYDAMRLGLPASAAQQAEQLHTVDSMQRARKSTRGDFEAKMETARVLYGTAFVMRMKTEVAQLSMPQRLPGLPNSYLGLETVLGKDELLEFEDYLNLEQDRPVAAKFAVHDAMEIKYGFM